MLGVDERVVETGRRHYQIPESPNGFLIKLRQVIAICHGVPFYRFFPPYCPRRAAEISDSVGKSRSSIQRALVTLPRVTLPKGLGDGFWPDAWCELTDE